VYGEGMKTTSAKVIGYTRVSKENRDGKGVSLEEQSEWLIAEATRRGFDLEILSEGDGVSARKMMNRPILMATLDALDRGEAGALMVKKLDRLARNVADFLTILDRSRRGNWALIIGDLDIDTSTPMGEAMATISATFAQLERAKIAERTRDALAHKKAQGVVLGRPVVLAVEVSQRVLALRQSGASLQAIADTLNQEQVPTAHNGAKWYPSSVSKVLQRVA
jgi:DNA invertase Pin-like site-specific DNA recombinase